MASEEDNFDIDIYGDGGDEYQESGLQDGKPSVSPLKVDATGGDKALGKETDGQTAQSRDQQMQSHDQQLQDEIKEEGDHPADEPAQKISSTDPSATDSVQLPKQAPQIQGTKRKEGEQDERHIDPGATNALFVSELHWWITDDDIRGWANQTHCEDELEDITFSEHKVNGKSKGQAYVLLKSMQAATAVKQRIETFGQGQQYAKKFTVGYTNPYSNPFKTLPKDGPMRNNASANTSRASTGGMQPYSAGGYRGRGNSYNSRGGGMGNNNNSNRGGFQPQMGGFQGAGMAGWPAMTGMQPYGGFQGRGGMMNGMRGGNMGMRGARGSMMGMPMNMGAMTMPMAMPQMGAMGMTGTNGFQGNQAAFNPAMFNQQQRSSSGYGGGENPHPAKRTRQD